MLEVEVEHDVAEHVVLDRDRGDHGPERQAVRIGVRRDRRADGLAPARQVLDVDGGVQEYAHGRRGVPRCHVGDAAGVGGHDEGDRLATVEGEALLELALLGDLPGPRGGGGRAGCGGADQAPSSRGSSGHAERCGTPSRATRQERVRVRKSGHCKPPRCRCRTRRDAEVSGPPADGPCAPSYERVHRFASPADTTEQPEGLQGAPRRPPAECPAERQRPAETRARTNKVAPRRRAGQHQDGRSP